MDAGSAEDVTPELGGKQEYSPVTAHRCPCCGGRMIVIETFDRVRPGRSTSPSRTRIDTS
jgi:hypothetical protein